MNAPARLALYGLGLVVAFFAAFGLAGVIVPESFVSQWEEQSQMGEAAPELSEGQPETHR